LAAHASTLRIEVSGETLAGNTAAAASPAASPAAAAPCCLAVWYRSASTRCFSGLTKLPGAEISAAPTAGCRAPASRAAAGCICCLSKLTGAKVFATPCCATRTAACRSSRLVKLAGAEVVCTTRPGNATNGASGLAELPGAEVVCSSAAYRGGSHA
jgi:hypothetical protein